MLYKTPHGAILTYDTRDARHGCPLVVELVGSYATQHSAILTCAALVGSYATQHGAILTYATLVGSYATQHGAVLTYATCDTAVLSLWSLWVRMRHSTARSLLTRHATRDTVVLSRYLALNASLARNGTYGERRTLAGALMLVDRGVGDIVAELQANDGMWNDTLLIVLSDNGAQVLSRRVSRRAAGAAPARMWGGGRQTAG